MSFVSRPVNAARVIARLPAVACALVACACAAQAQVERREASQQPRPTPAVVRADAAVGQNADENFELNIPERRITEQNFFASTAVAAGEEGARGLDLRVGVAVGAERIDVTLRNVRGRVRFRGSLDALRRVLDARRPPATQPPPAERDVP